MTIAERRLQNQGLSKPHASSVVEVVKAFGAVQSQDYAAAKWALGLRTAGASESDVDLAFDDGRILRTHVMRPTWHFVDPSTIRWLLALTAPRIHAHCASQYRQLEIEDATRTRSQKVITRALRGGRHLTRNQLRTALERSGVETDSRRLAYLLMAAELDAVVCSGPRVGSQFTYALFDERVPPTRPPSPDAALAELARRYFDKHGPATARDFSWWAGVTVTTARTAIEMLGPSIASHRLGALTYWSTAPSQDARRARPGVHLLPVYDEYLVAYRDREAVPYGWSVRPSGSPVPTAFMNPLVVHGQVVGTWRRTLNAHAVAMEVIARRKFTAHEGRALRRAADTYGAFVRRPVTITFR